MRVLGMALAVVLLVACDRCGRDEEQTPSGTAGSATSGSSQPGDRPEPPPGPATLKLLGDPAAEGRVEIAVENRGTAPVELAAGLRVERANGEGTFALADDVGVLALRRDCETPASECLTLVPGGVLYPPAWLGTGGDAQCACDGCGPIAPGRYRFVGTTCAGGRIEGEPFEL